jgi:hypothetical protein
MMIANHELNGKDKIESLHFPCNLHATNQQKEDIERETEIQYGS